jgi:hypothetical protein
MKVLAVLLFCTVCAQAQTVADIARQERERQAKLRSTTVITSIQSLKANEAKPAASAAPDGTKSEPSKAPTEPAKDAPKPSAPASVDPVQLWNNRVEQLRAKIRGLQDQELALLLQQNQVTNQVYAPVTDPETQQRALAQLGQVQQQLAGVKKDLEESRRTLDAMMLAGPPRSK